MQFVAFDIETTGFLPHVDQIVEVAAVRFVNGKPVESYASLVNPKVRIPPEAARIHGITDEMVKDQPLIDKVLEEFSTFCASDPMVAHNAPFDTEFLKADIQKFETNAPKGLILDSCAMARKVIQGSANYKLGTLVAHLQIPVEGAYHRAEADARYCGNLFAIMLGRIFAQGQPVVLENLINLSSGQPVRFPQVLKSYRQLDLMGFLS
ncbi:MAG: 3'-5' exonuclease [Oligoflexia bacterium]|nr:3'-5' exonuclease [Oligoflexia bacterium]